MSSRFHFTDIVDSEDFDVYLCGFQDTYLVAKSVESVHTFCAQLNTSKETDSMDEDPKHFEFDVEGRCIMGAFSTTNACFALYFMLSFLTFFLVKC